MSYKYFLSAALSASMLAPSFALAAGGSDVMVDVPSESDVTEEEIMNAISPSADGLGGGGYGSIYPPYGGGVTVDASITREITPDFVAINAYCDYSGSGSREVIRDALNQIYNDIKSFVGKDGRVRRMGTVNIYPYYGPTGEATDKLSGNLSILIRITNLSASSRITDYIESKNCSASWDVRLVDTMKHELDVLDELTARLNKRKTIFEKLLKKKLTRVLSVNLSTWVDGYSTYDPDTNTAEATTNLNVNFDLGGRTTIQTPKG